MSCNDAVGVLLFEAVASIPAIAVAARVESFICADRSENCTRMQAVRSGTAGD